MFFSFRILPVGRQVKNQRYSLEVKRGEDILSALDKFLKTNRIRCNVPLRSGQVLKDLKLVNPSAGGENGLTSVRIAETIIKIFNFVFY